MLVGKIVDRVWAVKKLDELPAGALLKVELEDSAKDCLIAFDPLGCGEGERVLIVTGSAAGRAHGQHNAPIDAVVVASLEEATNNKKPR